MFNKGNQCFVCVCFIVPTFWAQRQTINYFAEHLRSAENRINFIKLFILAALVKRKLYGLDTSKQYTDLCWKHCVWFLLLLRQVFGIIIESNCFEESCHCVSNGRFSSVFEILWMLLHGQSYWTSACMKHDAEAGNVETV